MLSQQKHLPFRANKTNLHVVREADHKDRRNLLLDRGLRVRHLRRSKLTRREWLVARGKMRAIGRLRLHGVMRSTAAVHVRRLSGRREGIQLLLPKTVRLLDTRPGKGAVRLVGREHSWSVATHENIDVESGLIEEARSRSLATAWLRHERKIESRVRGLKRIID